MAQEKDITSRAKFFTRKKTCKEELLCEICKHHRHVLIMRVGCDAVMFTKFKRGTLGECRDAIYEKKYLHFWCLDADDPPACLEQFKTVGVIK